MDTITKVTVDSIKKYFATLSRFGYKKYMEVDVLLILTFIDDLTSIMTTGYMSQEDYEAIVEALSFLTNKTCLIEFPKYTSYNDIVSQSKK